MLTFPCSGCSRKIKAQETSAGKKVKCPHCGQAVAVPASSATLSPLEGTLPAPATGIAEPQQQAATLAPPTAAVAGADQELYDYLAPAQAPDELGRLGPYRVLKVLGAGGMGVVFLAEDPQLQRRVALKAMKPVLAASDSAKKRFLREARATAALKHDHIVSIYQVGEDRGVPYLAMEFLEGEALDERIKRENILQLSEVLRIGREMAEGLEAAHERGLIHRDIKPGNIWLEGKRGRAKILDFGLARSNDDDSQLTGTGAIVGTPAYMSPEQARGEPVDRRCDLFSLGSVLYRLCTGQLPFKGANAISTLASLYTQEPTPLRQLNPAIPAALAEVIGRLMAKDPDQRYASAQEVAAALEAVQESPTVTAAPARRSASAPATMVVRRGSSVPWRWLALGSTAAVVLGLAVWAVVHFHKGSPPAAGPDTEAEQPREGEGPPAVPADALRRENIPPDELAAAGDGDPQKALPELVAVLGDSRLKQWSHVTSVALSQDGKLLASAGYDGAVRLWDPATGKALRNFHNPGGLYLCCVALSPDGRTVAFASNGPHGLCDVATGRWLRSLDGLSGTWVSLTFSPDGQTVAGVLRDTLKLWETATGKVKRTIQLPAKVGQASDRTVAFSPDGSGVAAACEDHKAYLLDTATGNLRQTFTGHTGSVEGVAFSPDGKTLASGSADQTVRIWSVASGANQRTFQADAAILAFSPDGQTLAANGGNGGGIRLWDLTSGEERSIAREVSYVHSLSFSGKGTTLAAGSGLGGVTLWDTATGKATVTSGPVTYVAVSPDGRIGAATGSDQGVRLWDLATGQVQLPPLQLDNGTLIFSPDGKLLAIAGKGGIGLWEFPTGKPRGRIDDARPCWRCRPTFSPSGRTLAWGEDDGKVKMLDLETREMRQILEGHKAEVNCVAFSPNGQLLASGSSDKTVRVWDLATGKERHQLAGDRELVFFVAFSSDGQTLAATEHNAAAVRLWDVATGKPRGPLKFPRGGSDNSPMAFSPDGQTLAVGNDHAEVQLWDWRKGLLRHTYRLQPRPCCGRVVDVTFTPDGRHLVTGNGNGTVYVFRLAPPPSSPARP